MKLYMDRNCLCSASKIARLAVLWYGGGVLWCDLGI